eukprot:9406792-Ditylum_brightwellii.AAC.1
MKWQSLILGKEFFPHVIATIASNSRLALAIVYPIIGYCKAEGSCRMQKFIAKNIQKGVSKN